MSPRWRLAVLAGLFTVVTACGGGGDDGGDGVASIEGTDTPTSTKAEDDVPDIDQMRAYAKCMREHGVDVEDPKEGEGIAIAAEDGDKEKVDKAMEACKKHLPNGGVPPKPSAEDLDEARELAKCLREHGIDVKEPTMEEPGISVNGGSGDPADLDRAMEECAPDAKVDTKGSGGGK